MSRERLCNNSCHYFCTIPCITLGVRRQGVSRNHETCEWASEWGRRCEDGVSYFFIYGQPALHCVTREYNSHVRMWSWGFSCLRKSQRFICYLHCRARGSIDTSDIRASPSFLFPPALCRWNYSGRCISSAHPAVTLAAELLSGLVKKLRVSDQHYPDGVMRMKHEGRVWVKRWNEDWNHPPAPFLSIRPTVFVAAS